MKTVLPFLQDSDRKFIATLLFLTILFCMIPFSGIQAITYKVGPGKPYANIQAVQNLLKPGDIVEVDGNATYSGGIYLSKDGTAGNRIIILGIKINGKRPVISGGKFGFEIYGDYNTIEGFDITATTKAAIGHYAEGSIVRDCIIHDNSENGVIGWGTYSGSLTLEYSELFRNGVNKFHPGHQIYMATDEIAYPNAVFRLQYCYIHSANGGNNVKTRSGRNEIYYNWIESAFYSAVELLGPDPEDNPNTKEDTKREDSDVVGNVIITKDNYACVRIGGDGTGQTKGRYRFVNNTFIIPSKGDVIRMFDKSESIEMHNNVIYNKNAAGGTEFLDDADGIWVSGRKVGGSNNWIQSGTTKVPSEFTGTVSGSNPGFMNISTNDVRPAPGSVLVNTGNPSPATLPGNPFPNPLFPPAYHPPLHTLQLWPAAVRPVVSTIDIGAYEYGTATGIEFLFTYDTHVFPNPADLELNILLAETMYQPVQFKITDMSGKIITAGMLEAGAKSKTISVKEFATGMYLLTMEISRGPTIREKVIVIH